MQAILTEIQHIGHACLNGNKYFSFATFKVGTDVFPNSDFATLVTIVSLNNLESLCPELCPL
jgi:hypothetical protein